MTLPSPAAPWVEGQCQFLLLIFFFSRYYSLECYDLRRRKGSRKWQKTMRGEEGKLCLAANRLSRSNECGESYSCEGISPLIITFFSHWDLLIALFCFCSVTELNIQPHFIIHRLSGTHTMRFSTFRDFKHTLCIGQWCSSLWCSPATPAGDAAAWTSPVKKPKPRRLIYPFRVLATGSLVMKFWTCTSIAATFL